jgi:hypothetical protein
MGEGIDVKLGDIALKDAREGARPVGTIWQAAQSRSNTADSGLTSDV